MGLPTTTLDLPEDHLRDYHTLNLWMQIQMSRIPLGERDRVVRVGLGVSPDNLRGISQAWYRAQCFSVGFSSITLLAFNYSANDPCPSLAQQKGPTLAKMAFLLFHLNSEATILFPARSIPTLIFAHFNTVNHFSRSTAVGAGGGGFFHNWERQVDIRCFFFLKIAYP